MPPILGALAAGAAAAASTIGAAFAGIGTFLSGGGLLAGIVKIGFSMAAQYVLGSLFSPKPTAQASKLETTYGDKRPREVILGRVGIAGHHVFRNANGSGNRRVTDVYRLSDFRISEIPRARGNGLWHDIDLDIDTIITDVTIRKHYGTDLIADAWLVGDSAGRWKSTSVGRGIAYAIIRSSLDIEGITTPWDPLFEVIGPYLYDWRNDDTAGGDGDDRWADPDSWTGNRENPVLQMYLLERGVFVNGSLIVGKGVSPSRLPLAEWTIAANICEEVPAEGGQRYRSSIIAVSGAGSTHDSNMQPLLEACAASWVEDASGEYPIVGAPQAVVATFTDDDLAVGQPVRFSAKRRRVELVNTVAGSFIDPEVFYEESPLATRIDGGALIVDGETLAVSLPFRAVTYPAQADRLADIQIRASRYQANADLTLRPKFLALKPGRWVTWNSQRYGNRTFLVVSKRLGALDTKAPRNVNLVLQEIDDGVFDPTEYATIPTVPLPPGIPDYQSELPGFLAEPYILVGDNETERPAIKLSWDPITDTTITGVQFEYWPTEQPEAVQVDSTPVDFTVKYLTLGVISGTEYQIRYRLTSNPSRVIPWVGPVEVTTPTASETDVTVKLGNLSPGMKELLANINAQQNLTLAQLQQLAAAAIEGIRQATDATRIAVRQGNASAAAVEELEVAITEVDGELNALASSVTALQATVGDTGAGALWRMVTQAGSGDIVARVVLQVRANVGAAWVAAATVWEAGFTGGNPLLPFGRIVLSADQIAITDGLGNTVALFEGGLSVLSVNAGELTAGILRSPDEKMVIDLDDGFISIRV